MGNIITKTRNAFRSPEDIFRFLNKSARATVELLRSRRWSALLGLVTAGIIGRNVYVQDILDRNEDGYIVQSIQGNEMFLDPTDKGISHDLVTFGSRERIANRSYREKLYELRDEVPGEVTVLEIGANIGYYALQTADILGDNAQIFAFEPSRKNIEQLTANVERNGYETIEIIHGAIGESTGSAQLHVSEQSNLHTVEPSGGRDISGEGEYVDSVNVPMYTVDRFLDDHGIPPESINVVRMDVEGYESNVVRGMERVLRAESPLLVFLELHPHRIGVEATNDIVEQLSANGFRVVTVSRSVHREPYETELDIDTFDELYGMERAYRLIAKR